MQATLDGDLIRLRGRLYQGSIKTADLPRWLRFYRRMRDRKGGQYARHYQPTIDALEAVAKELDTQ